MITNEQIETAYAETYGRDRLSILKAKGRLNKMLDCVREELNYTSEDELNEIMDCLYDNVDDNFNSI